MRRLLPWLENALRRYPWIITLLALIPCAYFAARGTSEMMGSKLFAADTEALARPVPSAVSLVPGEQGAAQNRHVRDRVAIVHRNIFDSEAGCLDCADAATDVVDESAVAVNPLDDRIIPPEACDGDPARAGQAHPPPCDSQAKIMGAVVSSDDEWSFAFVQATAGGPMMPYRMGQEIEGRAVSLVSHCPALGAYVLLRPAGQPRCFLAQVMPARPPAPPVAAPVAAPAGPAPGGALAAALEGIERAGANEFNVRRSTVDRILENQAELMRTTRIMPHEEGGRVVGVQLFGVRGNSLLGRLGMQNGDVLNRINGLEIASPDRALEAYSRLRTSDHLQISLTRNGQPVNVDFNIR